MDSKRKATIIQRIEALFPFLEEIMGKNDKRSQEIINKLMALRDGLDGIFEAFGEDLHALDAENEDLRRQLAEIQKVKKADDEVKKQVQK